MMGNHHGGNATGLWMGSPAPNTLYIRQWSNHQHSGAASLPVVVVVVVASAVE